MVESAQAFGGRADEEAATLRPPPRAVARSPLPVLALSLSCDACGRVARDPDARFCNACGAALAVAPQRPRLAAVPRALDVEPDGVALGPGEVVGRPAIAPLSVRVPIAQTTRTRRSPRTDPSEAARARALRPGAPTGQPRPAVRRPTTGASEAVARPAPQWPAEPDLDLLRARRVDPSVATVALVSERHAAAVVVARDPQEPAEPDEVPSGRASASDDPWGQVPGPGEDAAALAVDDTYDPDGLAQARRRRALVGVALAATGVLLGLVLAWT